MQTLPKKLKIAPTTLPIIAGNASAVFLTSHLRGYASLFNHFFKSSSSFKKEAKPHLPGKTLLIASSIVEIIKEFTVS